jgi:hypothetical protein
MKTRMLLLCLLFLIAGCAAKVEHPGELPGTAVDATTVSIKAQDPTATKDLYSNGKVKLVKTLHYRFQVENVNTAMEAIEAAVKKYPAYIADSKMELEKPILQNKISIRFKMNFSKI